MSTTFKIEGADELRAALLALPDKVSKRLMGQALRAGGEVVLAEARFNAPVKTGALAAGLKLRVTQGGGETTFEVMADPDTYYANMLESGTKKMKPHPFLARALEDTQAEATDRIGEALSESIEREAF